MVFYTEGLSQNQHLKDKTIVERNQEKYLTMLHRYLKDKFPRKADSNLAKGVMIMLDSKEAFDIHKLRVF